LFYDHRSGDVVSCYCWPLMEAPVLVVKFNPTEPIQLVHECLNVPTLKRSSWGSEGVPGETLAWNLSACRCWRHRTTLWMKKTCSHAIFCVEEALQKQRRSC